jgi:hypothetical protein
LIRPRDADRTAYGLLAKEQHSGGTSALALPSVVASGALEIQRRRHMAALSQLRERLLELTNGEVAHHHLSLPISHYQGLVRDRLFPDLKLRPVQNPADSGEH